MIAPHDGQIAQVTDQVAHEAAIDFQTINPQRFRKDRLE